jgi:PhzF family phenazine biosynthesis protein
MGDVLRIAAFSSGSQGGNPAGVLIRDELPDEAQMQRMAAEVGFSETAFAAPLAQGASLGVEPSAFRVRYFSPEVEVPFCGHATIALGAALAHRFGPGSYRLAINAGEISVSAEQSGAVYEAALQSPPTRSMQVAPALVDEYLHLLGYSRDELDARIPPARIHAGADHLVLALRSRDALRRMTYVLSQGQRLMLRDGFVTLLLLHAQSEQVFHTRNAFASGGVLEDPATGAATAALAGYLRDLQWPHGGRLHITQGEDMGMRSELHAEFGDQPGSSIRVSGQARWL